MAFVKVSTTILNLLPSSEAHNVCRDRNCHDIGTTTNMAQWSSSQTIRADSLAGHEVVGVVAAVGKSVKDFKVGERVVADNSVLPTTHVTDRQG